MGNWKSGGGKNIPEWEVEGSVDESIAASRTYTYALADSWDRLLVVVEATNTGGSAGQLDIYPDDYDNGAGDMTTILRDGTTNSAVGLPDMLTTNAGSTHRGMFQITGRFGGRAHIDTRESAGRSYNSFNFGYIRNVASPVSGLTFRAGIVSHDVRAKIYGENQ